MLGKKTTSVGPVVIMIGQRFIASQHAKSSEHSVVVDKASAGTNHPARDRIIRWHYEVHIVP